MMTREEMQTAIIHIYGFENPITVHFFEACAQMPQTPLADAILEAAVKAHQAHPNYGDEEDE